MATPLEQLQKRMNSDIPMKWVFAGDSITHGALHTWGWRDYTEHFGERLRWELCRHRDLVIKTGVSGNTAQMILNDLEWSVLQFDADVVALMIGTNDCALSRGGGTDGLFTFRQDILSLIERIQAANRDTAIVLQTPNPILPEAMNDRGTISHYADELRKIAAERNLLLVDHWNYWLEAIPATPIRATAWMNDSIHPGHFGHLAMARLLLQTLELWEPVGNLGRLFLP